MPKPYTTLILCFDGTWNTSQTNTNVVKVYSEIADRSTGCSWQRKFYDEGVGTKWYERVRGGVFGAGLDNNIRLGYGWLAQVYESVGDDPGGVEAPDVAPGRLPNGDRPDVRAPSGEPFPSGSDIYLFGFSRGAFTARSLGGMVSYLGIPRIEPAKAADPGTAAEQPLIKRAWELYAQRPPDSQRDSDKPGDRQAVQEHDAAVAAFRLETNARYPVRIHFIGVWDTVGALGIPRVFDRDLIPRFSTKYQFHNTALSASVRNAFHAVAIDEQRLPYVATLWSALPTPIGGVQPVETVQQRWFPGAHADVGGGYKDSLLPAAPLKWLADQAAACGLMFSNDRRLPSAGTEPGTQKVLPYLDKAPAAFDLDGTEYQSPVHDSYAEFLGGAYRIMRSIPGMGGRSYRRMLVPADGINQVVDETAFEKWKVDPEYRPPNLGQAGRTDVTFNVAGDGEGFGVAAP